MPNKENNEKESDAKAFEASLNEKTKSIIESLLSTTDEKSRQSANVTRNTLEALLGESVRVFITNILDNTDPQWINEITSISPQTKEYCLILMGKYSARLRGILSKKTESFADSWSNFRLISNRYDFATDNLVLKVSIIKNDNSTIVLEDTAQSLIELSYYMINCAVNAYNEASEAPIDLGPLKNSVLETETALNKVFKKVSTKKEENQS